MPDPFKPISDEELQQELKEALAYFSNQKKGDYALKYSRDMNGELGASACILSGNSLLRRNTIL